MNCIFEDEMRLYGGMERLVIFCAKLEVRQRELLAPYCFVFGVKKPSHKLSKTTIMKKIGW